MVDIAHRVVRLLPDVGRIAVEHCLLAIVLLSRTPPANRGSPARRRRIALRTPATARSCSRSSSPGSIPCSSRSHSNYRTHHPTASSADRRTAQHERFRRRVDSHRRRRRPTSSEPLASTGPSPATRPTRPRGRAALRRSARDRRRGRCTPRRYSRPGPCSRARQPLHRRLRRSTYAPGRNRGSTRQAATSRRGTGTPHQPLKITVEPLSVRASIHRPFGRCRCIPLLERTVPYFSGFRQRAESESSPSVFDSLHVENESLPWNFLLGLRIVDRPELRIDIELPCTSTAPEVIIRRFPGRVAVRTAIPPLLGLLRDLHFYNWHASGRTTGLVMNDPRQRTESESIL